jgi:glycosyltransferase involved in cell wall biosynthesis
MTQQRRLAAFLSHPIQYLVPLMRRLAAHPAVDLSVFFMTDTGVRAGHIAGYGPTIKWDVPLLDGYRHEFLPNVSPRAGNTGPLARLNPGIVAKLARGRFDALYLHGYMSLSEWVAYGAAKALRLPILFHGDVVLHPYGGHPSFGRQAFRKAFFAGIDAALVPSTKAYDFYDAYGVPRERTFWAPLCVDNDWWTSRGDEQRPRKAEVRRELGVDPELPVVLFVAHMREVKRPLDAVRAFAQMKTPATLVMVGEGPQLADVQRFVEERPELRVRLLGARNQGDLPALYAAADVFVLSSEHEVNPLVIREAMCCDLPVVVSDGVQVTADFVREGENGFTYPMGDSKALAERLDAVLVDPARRAAMAARSREVIAPWNYGTTVDGILTALDAVTAGKRRR